MPQPLPPKLLACAKARHAWFTATIIALSSRMATRLERASMTGCSNSCVAYGSPFNGERRSFARAGLELDCGCGIESAIGLPIPALNSERTAHFFVPMQENDAVIHWMRW